MKLEEVCLQSALEGGQSLCCSDLYTEVIPHCGRDRQVETDRTATAVAYCRCYAWMRNHNQKAECAAVPRSRQESSPRYTNKNS